MKLFPLILLPMLLALGSCAVREDRIPREAPTSSYLTASDGKRLSLRHWNRQAKPETVIIALHGIEGAARDFGNLGKTLATQAPKTTLFALNLRGNGYDPVARDRGDVASARLWQQDLLELDSGLRQRHPEARVVWLGESMGSLIAAHTVAEAERPPDGLILVSPVVSLESIPAWQVKSLKLAAFLAPRARVSLETLAGGSFQATTQSDHFQQSAGNAYHVGRYSLRYLRGLARLSQAMEKTAPRIRLPTLILHGGKDFLTNKNQVSRFANSFARRPDVHEFEDSHHLLFYDKQRSAVVSRILKWSQISRGERG